MGISNIETLHNGSVTTEATTLNFLESQLISHRDAIRDVEKSIWRSYVFFSGTDGITRRGCAAQRGVVQAQTWTSTTDW